MIINQELIKQRLLNELKHVNNIITILQKTNACIAGGAILSCFLNTKINDFDIYFNNKYDYHLAFNEILNEIRKKTRNKTTKEIYQETSFGKYIIHYSKNIKNKGIYYKNCFLHLIEKYSGTPKEIIDGFDFTVCMAAYDFKTNSIIIGKHFFRDLFAKKLIVNWKGIINDNYKLIRTIQRIRKYRHKGFTPIISDIIKFNILINAIPEEEIFENNLGGYTSPTEIDFQMSKNNILKYLDMLINTL